MPAQTPFIGRPYHVLSTREAKLLHSLHFESMGRPDRFNLPGELKGTTGVGPKSYAKLVELGLIETGVGSRHNEGTGYRITLDGHRCLYGKAPDQIAADGERGIQTHERKVLSWPL